MLACSQTSPLYHISTRNIPCHASSVFFWSQWNSEFDNSEVRWDWGRIHWMRASGRSAYERVRCPFSLSLNRPPTPLARRWRKPRVEGLWACSLYVSSSAFKLAYFLFASEIFSAIKRKLHFTLNFIHLVDINIYCRVIHLIYTSKKFHVHYEFFRGCKYQSFTD